ncbi:hypothetical protein SAY86_006039 [Trapa natans]|uniref:RING-type domain-containing protein n=1 Tax=Trapa natans TaxID=22666 RepID=A0AAN7L3W5_TRANT|nr:hypothetical protein SAY86_006039 [Trapa natans]
MSVVHETTPHLRDFLLIKDDDAGAAAATRQQEAVGFMLGTVTHLDMQPSPRHSRAISAVPASRTLLEIIRDEEPSVGLSYKCAVVGQGHCDKDKKSWKSFKDRFRLRRACSTWRSTGQVPSPGFQANKICMPSSSSARYGSGTPTIFDGLSRPENSASMEGEFRDYYSSGRSIAIEPSQASESLQRSPRYTLELPESVTPSEDPPREGIRRLSVVLAEERQLSAREAAAAQEAASGAEQAARMSLMDLLEETEREFGMDGTTRYSAGKDLEAAAEEEECRLDHGGRSVGGGGAEHNCCICMVRHKGAAFIPCGHTFCRLCSRELWVSRGNCPLCNNYILEILDIF